MYCPQRGFRNFFAGLQLAAVCAMTIALATSPMARAQPCDPPPTGTMVAWYPFDEPTGPGPSANLATGNAAAWDSTPPTPVAGMVGNALNFDGLSNYIDAPSTIITNFGPAGLSQCPGGTYSTCQGDFSIDVWVNLNAAVQGVETIVDKRDATPIGYSFYLYRDTAYSNNTYIGVQLASSAEGYTNYFSKPLTPVQFAANTWYHLAVTVKRTGKINWYLNGASKNPNPNPSLIQIGSLVNNAQLRIGANGLYDGPINFFNGSLDELEIFNRVLKPPEVTAIYQAGTSGKCKP